MKISDIKKGRWYQTKQGIGECLIVGGTSPPSAMFNITRPIPRGKVNLSPRDVISAVEPPAAAPAVATQPATGISRTVVMERRFFCVNSAGENEFEYLLHLLGVPEVERKDIDEVSFNVDHDSIDYGQDA